MLTTRYHIGSIVAIFFALGIGILIGGTLGQTWMNHTENNLVDRLMTRYENQIQRTQSLEKQIVYLQTVNQQLTPRIQNKKVVWYRSDDQKQDMLSFVMKSAGIVWEEVHLEEGTTPADLANKWRESVEKPDLLIVSGTNWTNEWPEEVQTVMQEDIDHPKIIYLEPEQMDISKPAAIAEFLQYLKTVLEDETHAAFYFYHYSGL
ncbi:copper transporter [Marinicrinis lubricantis]|uniref:Copper transporter n=1 Tax=Marinicrinis lubricantis TaxID=2086470 RepID=A0ABW1ISJ0_9BACL